MAMEMHEVDLDANEFGEAIIIDAIISAIVDPFPLAVISLSMLLLAMGRGFNLQT